MQHPEINSIESYSRRSLPPAEMLTLGDHISVCDSCRDRLKSFTLRGPGNRDLQAMLGEDVAAHLSTNEIEMAAGGPNALSTEAKAHLAGCSQCREELAELRRFYSPITVMQPKQAAPRKSAIPGWTGWAGLAAAGVLIALLVPQMRRHPAEAPAIAVAELHDGGGAIGLDSNGRLSGATNMPPEYASLLIESLQSHRLPTSGSAAQQSAPGEGLRTETVEAPKFDVVYPRDEVTTGKPVFRWTALPGARSYQVELYDANFNLVEKSPKLRQLDWIPSAPLTANGKYRWAVNGTTADGITQAPSPSSAEARFTVADSATLSAIDTAERQFAGSHLLLATLYAKAGMRSLARSEIDSLSSQNPGSKLVQDLSESLHAADQSSPSKAKPAQ